MEINYLVEQVIKNYTEFDYDKLVVEYIFTLQGSYNFIVTYMNGTNSTKSEISNKAIRDTARQMKWSKKFQKSNLRSRNLDRLIKNAGELPIGNPSEGLTSEGYKILFTSKDGKIN